MSFSGKVLLCLFLLGAAGISVPTILGVRNESLHGYAVLCFMCSIFGTLLKLLFTPVRVRLDD